MQKSRNNPKIKEHFISLQELIKSVRTIRSEFTIPPEKKIRIKVKTDKGFLAADFFRESSGLIKQFINAAELDFTDLPPDSDSTFPVAGNGFESYLFLGELIDIPGEIEKLGRESGKMEKLIFSTEKKLSNEKFLNNAPDDVILKEKGKLTEFAERNSKIKSYLDLLKR